jgi:hypothetical protein
MKRIQIDFILNEEILSKCVQWSDFNNPLCEAARTVIRPHYKMELIPPMWTETHIAVWTQSVYCYPEPAITFEPEIYDKVVSPFHRNLIPDKWEFSLNIPDTLLLPAILQKTERKAKEEKTALEKLFSDPFDKAMWELDMEYQQINRRFKAIFA